MTTTKGEGVFMRSYDGTLRQQHGTGQTPVFKTPQQLSRYVHKHFACSDGARLPRMVRNFGWFG